MTPANKVSLYNLNKFKITVIENIIEFLETPYYRKLSKFYLGIQKSEIHGEDLDNGYIQVIFDVGANTGQSVFLFKKIFPTSLIYSFEPQVETFERLSMNLESGGVSAVKIFNLGLSNTNGESDFHVSPLSLVSTFSPSYVRSKYSVLRNFLLGNYKSAYSREVRAPVATLDQICRRNRIEEIFILKVDVEGHELEVLQGARGMIKKKNIGFIQLERQRNYLRESRAFEIDKILTDSGYSKILEIRHLFGILGEDIYFRGLIK
jgi:FkbM family methyltransferase